MLLCVIATLIVVHGLTHQFSHKTDDQLPEGTPCTTTKTLLNLEVVLSIITNYIISWTNDHRGNRMWRPDASSKYTLAWNYHTKPLAKNVFGMVFCNLLYYPLLWKSKTKPLKSSLQKPWINKFKEICLVHIWWKYN